MPLEEPRGLERPLATGEGADAVDEHAAGGDPRGDRVEQTGLQRGHAVDVARDEAPLRLGLFPNIQQAITAKAGGYDDTLQLGIIYKGDANTDLIAILEGNGDRQLLAPFGFATPIGMNLVQSAPFVTAAGNFDGEGPPDVMTLGQDFVETADGSALGPVRAWFAQGRTGGRVAQPIAREPKQ